MDAMPRNALTEPCDHNTVRQSFLVASCHSSQLWMRVGFIPMKIAIVGYNESLTLQDFRLTLEGASLLESVVNMVRPHHSDELTGVLLSSLLARGSSFDRIDCYEATTPGLNVEAWMYDGGEIQTSKIDALRQAIRRAPDILAFSAPAAECAALLDKLASVLFAITPVLDGSIRSRTKGFFRRRFAEFADSVRDPVGDAVTFKATIFYHYSSIMESRNNGGADILFEYRDILLRKLVVHRDIQSTSANDIGISVPGDLLDGPILKTPPCTFKSGLHRFLLGVVCRRGGAPLGASAVVDIDLISEAQGAIVTSARARINSGSDSLTIRVDIALSESCQDSQFYVRVSKIFGSVPFCVVYVACLSYARSGDYQ